MFHELQQSSFRSTSTAGGVEIQTVCFSSAEQRGNEADLFSLPLFVFIEIWLFYYLQGGKQTTCPLPEVFGDGTLDLWMHREEEICAQTVKNDWDEKETQGEWKQTPQHYWVRRLHHLPACDKKSQRQMFKISTYIYSSITSVRSQCSVFLCIELH